MSIRRYLTFALVLVLASVGVGISNTAPAAAAPSAPSPRSPAANAAVPVPFRIAWSPAADPSGVYAYNWQVSATASFAKVLRQDSTMGSLEATVSGLGIGTYYWRVQGVSNAGAQGAWSTPRSVRVTGAGPGLPATPVLNQPRGGTQFHPWESFGMSWSGVVGTSKYVLEASKDPAFPASGVVFRFESPSPSTEILITDVDMGDYRARVFAVNAEGISSMPSNVIPFRISYNAPIAAAPTIVSPTGGATLSMPIPLRWTHVVNPQSSGYQVQISRNSTFTQIEQNIPQLNGPDYSVLQLPTAGPKYWRVRSFQGTIDAAGRAAATAWSPVGRFTVADGPVRVSTITLSHPAPASGQEVYVDLQLNRAVPASGATVRLASSDPTAAPLPPSVPVQGSTSWVQFRFSTGQVAAPTTATITATIGSEATSHSFTVSPASLRGIEGLPLRVSGGVGSGGIVMLNGQAPAGGAVVTLTSNHPGARPPASITIPAGVESAAFPMATSEVGQDTPVTITASWDGRTVQASTTLTPQPVPTSLTLEPSTTTGTSGSFGRVTAADPRSEDVAYALSTSRPDLVHIPSLVIVPQYAAAGGFMISTEAVSTRTLVNISVRGGGVTVTAVLTLDSVARAT